MVVYYFSVKAVFICTPVGTHAALITKALNAGQSVGGILTHYTPFIVPYFFIHGVKCISAYPVARFPIKSPPFHNNGVVSYKTLTICCALKSYEFRISLDPPSGLAWSLYKCGALWMAVYGSSATKRSLGNYSKRVGNFFPVPGFYLVAIWPKLLKAT